MIEVIAVDDHPLFLEGIRTVLHNEGDKLKVIDEVSNGAELLSSLSEKVPDIVLLDITLPGRNGIDVLQDLKKIYPQLPVLILSMHSVKHFAVRALKAGAEGYLNKRSNPSDLISAIDTIVKKGKRFITTEVGEELAEQLSHPYEKAPHELLSDREYEVLCLIAEGKEASEIAEDLLVSVQTIYTYCNRVKEKMNMKSNAQLIRYGIENGLID